MSIFTVSVVIPAHNRPDRLKRAVQSVFGQTFLPAELIVVDDGSDSAVSKDIFRGCPSGLDSVLLRADQPKGPACARNMGVAHATGSWIAFLDDDDEFFPKKLAVMKKAIDEHPEADVLYHPAVIEMVNENIRYRSGVASNSSSIQQSRQILLKNTIGGTSMVMVRKEALVAAGGFDEQLPALEDYELWIRLMQLGMHFVCIDEALTRYHHDTHNKHDTHIKSLTHSIEKEVLARKYIEEKHRNVYDSLSLKEVKQLNRNKLKSMVFKALLNRDRGAAMAFQYRLLRDTLHMADLLALLAIPLGTKVVFRLRSFV